MGNEAERLAALEAQINSFDSQLHEIKNALLRMDTKLDAWQSTYVPRAEISEMLRSRDEKIIALQQDIADIHDEKQANKQLLPNWVQVGIAIAAVAISLYGANN
ncbi:hypothetical protein [Paenibacillus hexagrammi]|uniref:DUF1640 domain-containing protein n=1 Tax=Paenibacillus hexagrammi TaxID=2908839 RepID=A0ABY3SSJ7_9BACL|nr:hypothetical protein [Paenibacillus sp. YPD9-1]UJF36619.1 hypothetical protein L0M14_30485 [Paenibacillus sp. YPD9-1]